MLAPKTIDDVNHSLIFYPKFHCELDFIELVWGFLKSKLKRQCSFSFKDLEQKLSLEMNNIPVAFVRRANRHCFRFMSGYRNGLSGCLLDYAMKKYRGHRQIPAGIVADIENKA